MNKMIGFVLTPKQGGYVVTAVRRVGDEYKHKHRHNVTLSSMKRLSYLTYQTGYRAAFISLGTVHITRNFHIPLQSY